MSVHRDIVIKPSAVLFNSLLFTPIMVWYTISKDHKARKKIACVTHGVIALI